MNGWLIAALLGEMAGHEGEAAFENVESKFPFTEMYQTRERGGTKALARKGGADTLERGKGMEGNTWVFTFRMNSKTGIRVCSFMWADNYWILSHKTANQDK